MTLSATITFAANAGLVAGGYAIGAVVSEVTPGQGWTLLGLVAVMILAQWRFTEKQASQLERLSVAIGGYSAKLATLAEKFESHDRDTDTARDQAVATLRDDIADIPEKIANRLAEELVRRRRRPRG